MTPLEKIGVVVIVAAVLITVAVLAWQLLRPSKVPPRVIELTPEIEDRIVAGEIKVADPQYLLGHHVQVFDGRRLRAFDEFPAPTPERERSWPPGPTEDTRICFRRFLAGGPDYYHQEG